jgi:hypothetical protein
MMSQSRISQQTRSWRGIAPNVADVKIERDRPITCRLNALFFKGKFLFQNDLLALGKSYLDEEK